MSKNKKYIPTKHKQDSVKILRNLPVSMLIASINTTLGVLREKGIQVTDYDGKARRLYKLQLIGGKVYFLAESGEKK